MVQSQYSLSWECYQSNLSKGFRSLQQNGEFVDMTLAADGYFVKVHKVVMALASPYLKELISSAPCQHPVLFLNNVSHKTLAYLLEYLYTGEVVVPADYLSLFTNAAQSLHIKGLDNISGHETMNLKVATNLSPMEDGEICHVSGIKRVMLPVRHGNEEVGLPAAAKKICFKQGTSKSSPGVSSKTQFQTQPLQNANLDPKDGNEYESMVDCNIHDADDDLDQIDVSKESSSIADKASSNLQFTVSIRGSLQMILNRYIYNLHSTTYGTGIRRWRCVDYRNQKCMAFVVTKDNIVTSRANLHKHPFHDKKILSKIKKQCVFSALEDVQGHKEKDVIKMTDSDFISMDDFSEIS